MSIRSASTPDLSADELPDDITNEIADIPNDLELNQEDFSDVLPRLPDDMQVFDLFEGKRPLPRLGALDGGGLHSGGLLAEMISEPLLCLRNIPKNVNTVENIERNVLVRCSFPKSGKDQVECRSSSGSVSVYSC